MFDHQCIVDNVEHLDDACRSYVALGDASEERVASQIVQAVHVELTGDELMEEVLGILILEDADGERELSAEVMVHLFHHHQRDVFVRDAADKRVFQYMRERPVSDVVHQDGSFNSLGFAVEYEQALVLQREDGLAHQMEGSERVLEARVAGSRVDHRRQSELVDAAQTLEKRVLHDVEQQSARYLDEPEHRVIDYFEVVHIRCAFVYVSFFFCMCLTWCLQRYELSSLLLYKQADIMFQPTLLESFTATYPEAMRMEVPIVTSDLEFAHGLCGNAAVYYSPLDAEKAGEAIYKVATDNELRKLLVGEGKKQLKNFLDAEARADRLIQLTEEMVGNKN